jgi:hypothetical protein
LLKVAIALSIFVGKSGAGFQLYIFTMFHAENVDAPHRYADAKRDDAKKRPGRWGQGAFKA